VVGCLRAKVAGYPSTKGFLAPFVVFYKNMSPISTPQELTTMATPLKFVNTDSLFQVLQTLSHHISAVTSIICLLLPFFFAHITTVLGKE
jgi:hypothetical protein